MSTRQTRHSDTRFSHGICPPCYATRVAHPLDEIKRKREATGSEARDAGVTESS